MLEQLRSVSENLRASIDNYLGVCSIIHDRLAHDLPRELSEYLEQEIASILPYEQKLQEARTLIGRARNYSTSVTPVNKLPSEILTRIFHMIAENLCCLPPVDCVDYYPYHSPYPGWLIQVCSRWRKIALSSPTLWTHIDLTPDLASGRRILDRARVYTERAGGMPYEIHIDDRGCTTDDLYRVDDIVSSRASRSEALVFTITNSELIPFHYSVFQGIILGCTPGIFKTLRVHSNNTLLHEFIQSCDHNAQEGDGGFTYSNRRRALPTLSCSDAQIDNALANVSTVHLHGVFFQWSSQLYCGLVDLRLSSPTDSGALVIPQSELVSILSRSPGLKILHFSLAISVSEDPWDNSADDCPFDPVSLQDLEEVHISTIGTRLRRRRFILHVGLLLRLLAPGSRPLRLSLETTNDPDEPLFGSDGTRDFFARSKVEKLWIQKGAPSIAELQRCYLADLKIMVFDNCQLKYQDASEITPCSCTWIVHDAFLNRSDLRYMVKSCTGSLVLADARVRADFGRKATVKDMMKEVPVEELRIAFPTVRFLEEGWSCGCIDWDIPNRYVFF